MFIESLTTIWDVTSADDTEMSCRYFILATSLWVMFVDSPEQALQILTAGILEGESICE